MSSPTSTNTGIDNGAYIPTGTIYNKVLELEKSLIQLKTIMTMMGFIIAPAVSAIVTLTINYLGGK